MDERYSQLTDKKWDKLAAIEEKQENKGNGSEHPANKGKKKKGINETGIDTGELEQVAAMQEKQPDSRRPMGLAWSNTGLPQQQAPWRPRPRVDSAPPPQPHYPAVNARVLPATSQPAAGPQPAQKDYQPQDLSQAGRQQPRNFIYRECGEPGHQVANWPRTICYSCNEFGHIAPACPKFPPSEHYCYKCNLPGYMARNRPKCNPLVQTP